MITRNTETPKLYDLRGFVVPSLVLDIQDVAFEESASTKLAKVAGQGSSGSVSPILGLAFRAPICRNILLSVFLYIYIYMSIYIYMYIYIYI